MSKEPVGIVAATQTVLLAIVNLVAFEADWSGDRTALVNALAGAVMLLVGAVVNRRRVASPATVQAEKSAAYGQGLADAERIARGNARKPTG